MAVRIGGDDSVAWSVEHGGRWVVVNEAPGSIYQKERLGAPDTINLNADSGRCEGRDPVNTEGKDFKITIKIPLDSAGRTAFLTSLANATKGITANSVAVTFSLPIVARDYDQITVEWAF